MATKDKKARKPMPISKDTHDKLIDYAVKMAKRQATFKEFKDKLLAIDRAYYTYRTIDVYCSKEEKKELESMIETPMVISHVESNVAYLSDVFLAGYPIFGVVTDKNNREAGEQMEAVISSHSTFGSWPEHILRFLLDGAKYNIHGLEAAWEPIRNINVETDASQVDAAPKAVSKLEYITKLRSPDLYNTFFDFESDPSSLSKNGDYIGYHEQVSRIKLKELMEEWNDHSSEYAGLINADKALNSDYPSHEYWEKRPKVADYEPTLPKDGEDWFTWLGRDVPDEKNKAHSSKYLLTTMYVRVIPDDFKMMHVPNAKSVQVYKLKIVNMQYITHVIPVKTLNNTLPIFMGQPLDDGFGYQTKSMSEVILPWQDAASELLNARLAASRRAVSDRAIYNPNYISEKVVNSRNPSAKMPMKQEFRMANMKASDVYYSIPFENQGTAMLMSDMQNIMNISDKSTGMDSFRQGANTKGNRTLGEYQDVAGNSEGRSRSLALRIEYQVFVPIKLQIKANILLHIRKSKMLSPASSKEIEIDPAKLREAIIDFKLADGYTPKSKIVNPESFNMIMQLFMAQPQTMTDPTMFELVAYMGSLIGITNLSQFKPQQQPAALPAAPTVPQGAPDGQNQ